MKGLNVLCHSKLSASKVSESFGISFAILEHFYFFNIIFLQEKVAGAPFQAVPKYTNIGC